MLQSHLQPPPAAGALARHLRQANGGPRRQRRLPRCPAVHICDHRPSESAQRGGRSGYFLGESDDNFFFF